MKNKKPTGGSQFVGPDGLTHYQRNKQKYIDKAVKRKRDMTQWIRDKKSQGSCVDCGISDWRVMDYDHLPQFKKLFSISDKLGNYSRANLEKEIAKCELVCSNCHRIRTYIRAGIV